MENTENQIIYSQNGNTIHTSDILSTTDPGTYRTTIKTTDTSEWSAEVEFYDGTTIILTRDVEGNLTVNKNKAVNSEGEAIKFTDSIDIVITIDENYNYSVHIENTPSDGVSTDDYYTIPENEYNLITGNNSLLVNPYNITIKEATGDNSIFDVTFSSDSDFNESEPDPEPDPDSCEHSNTSSTTITDATCTTEGSKKITCNDCKTSTTEIIPAKGHTESDDNWQTTKEATCTQGGTEDLICPDCGEVIQTRSISPTGHIYGDWIIDEEATCSKAGSKHKECTCPDCSDIIQETISATGIHTESDWIIDFDSTCQSTGSKHTECTVCHARLKTETIAKKSHTIVTIPPTNPTCTSTGLTEGKQCSVCGTIILEQTIVPLLAHEYSDWTETKAATETEAGEERRDCKNCDYFETSVIAPLNHDHNKWEKITLPAVAPTCTETGLTEGEKCSGCGEILISQETVPALDHDKQTHSAKAPTCTEIGWDAYVTCSRCDYTTKIEKAALGHTYNSVITSPTCTEKGYTTYTCHCGDTYIDAYVDATEHAYVNDICTICGHQKGLSTTMKDFFKELVRLVSDNQVTDATSVFARRNTQPLDLTTLFPSVACAEAYAAKQSAVLEDAFKTELELGPDVDLDKFPITPYPGQMLSVFDGNDIKVYVIQPDMSIKEIGSSSGGGGTEEDDINISAGKNININQGVISLIDNPSVTSLTASSNITSTSGQVKGNSLKSDSTITAGNASSNTTVSNNTITFKGNTHSATISYDGSGLKFDFT